jgi:hypothetical protein
MVVSGGKNPPVEGKTSSNDHGVEDVHTTNNIDSEGIQLFESITKNSNKCAKVHWQLKN